ncbi:S8 family serine peptidase [Paenibacillus sp. J5C_2022]|uniref:S8 family serine peptidase n=1 Tax=Paenibacillus sp. J5C2022 TaxID=2977129 RepID=UPI0021D11C1C|nr:S8 family serine peptidase [Paenibacillus sp. J5C2022]MCU6708486.1 S8 family serine peptidase [Paenibacillus sp. J5C2022]
MAKLAFLSFGKGRNETPTDRTGESRRANKPRRTYRHALLCLLASSVILGSVAPAGLAPASAAPPAAAVPPAAAGAADEQPQSWLLKWTDPALAHELRGVEVLHRQPETAVEVVRPAPDSGEDVESWLGRLRGEPGVQYVHPNNRVSILDASASGQGETGELSDEAGTAASQLQSEKPEAAASQWQSEKPEAVASQWQSEKPEAAASQWQSEKPEAGMSQHQSEKSEAAVSQQRSGKYEAAVSQYQSSEESEAATFQQEEQPQTEEQPYEGAAQEPVMQEPVTQEPAAQEPAAQEPPAALTPDQQAAKDAVGEAAEKAAASPTKANDPQLDKQTHLSRIGAQKAWQTVREQKDVIIGLVDTGVDLDHPDLKDNLVAGTNLIYPELPPDDDNGHGTGVAGVIGAVGNNGIGVAGVVWHAKIMPIKALDQWGDGTEKDLGEGILYAVRNGAGIVVMSVGLHRYSPYMEDIVRYAESQGVLLVAAAGNDGTTLGSKAAVKYPAAYPTVLAVGGSNSNGAPDPRSNPGSELDLLAPWNVYTTALDGEYKWDEGTSLAAPQVAGAAALLLAMHPEYEPYQVRAMLRQSAKDIGAAGVDSTSGYGLLRVDQVVAGELVPDANEPNNKQSAAAKLPLFSQVTAELPPKQDVDWYVVDTPTEGTLKLDFQALDTEQAVSAVRISHYTPGGRLLRSEDTKLSSKSISFTAGKGKQYVEVKFSNPANDKPMAYALTTSFTMKEDPYEPNDRHDIAFQLQPKSQTITASFHQKADRDWYKVSFEQEGKLQLSLSTDTVRIDPGLAVMREGQALTLFDENGEGEAEHSSVISVTPGQYYIRVHNAIAVEANATVGTYRLQVQFEPQLMDPNEPNDISYEGLMMKPGTDYIGLIHERSDTDWFQFRLSSKSIISLGVTGVPNDTSLKLLLYDKKMQQLRVSHTGSDGQLATGDVVLQPGVYYVRLTADRAFAHQYYRMKLTEEELVAGFRDIGGHWAQEEIAALTQEGIINGVGNYSFKPDRNITRAEAVALIVKAYKPNAAKPPGAYFSDLASTHWSYPYIMTAVQEGWVKGFPDGSFKPDQPVTRAEMAIMIGNAENIRPRAPLSPPFADVPMKEWYAPMLYSMKLEGKLKGMEDNSYKPDDRASRAQFTTLIYRYLTG